MTDIGRHDMERGPAVDLRTATATSGRFKSDPSPGRTRIRVGSEGGIQGVPLALFTFAWICALPLIVVIGIPLFGAAPTFVLAVGLLAALLAICLLICRGVSPRHGNHQGGHRPM